MACLYFVLCMEKWKCDIQVSVLPAFYAILQDSLTHLILSLHLCKTEISFERFSLAAFFSLV